MNSNNKQCYRCGTNWEGRTTPGYKEVCADCASYWHCCMNCRFLDRRTLHCLNSAAPKLTDIEKFNFCDEFVLVSEQDGARTKSESDAKKKFEGLFGK